MANLIDNPAVYPPAVYRIADTDAVQGWNIANGNGIANLAAQNLADRTAYLKAHLDAIEASAAKLVRAANLSDLADVPTARANLGLGSAALHGAADFQAALGFMPVHQGGGTGQLANTVFIGWSAAAKLKAQVDLTDLGNIALESWVLGLGYAASIANAVALANTAQATANYANLPAGTRMPFAQAAAPTGWTQDVTDTANNRMLRVVNTAGGGVSGVHSPIVNSVVPAHTHAFTSGNNSADHTHGVNDPGHAHTYYTMTGTAPQSGSSTQCWIGYQAASTSHAATGITLGGASSPHTHSGTTDNGSSSTNWTPRYIDMIICTKN